MNGIDESGGTGGRRRNNRWRPGHATVVAYVALFVALGGGSFAVAALNAHDQKVVKKIVNAQIGKQAAGLSVNHAKSADSATNANHAASADAAATATSATHAANADTATTATNADQLGGSPPSAFVSGQGRLRSSRLVLAPSSPPTEFLELGFGHISGVCDGGTNGKIRFVADLPVDNLIVWTIGGSAAMIDIATSNALGAGSFYEEPHVGGPQSVTIQATYNDGTHEQVATAWTTVQTAGGKCVFTGQTITTL